jgi:hypothetical protein
VSRYAYASFFAVMSGGVGAGVAGVVVGELSGDAGWGPVASGLIGTVLGAFVFALILRAAPSDPEERDRKG